METMSLGEAISQHPSKPIGKPKGYVCNLGRLITTNDNKWICKVPKGTELLTYWTEEELDGTSNTVYLLKFPTCKLPIEALIDYN